MLLFLFTAAFIFTVAPATIAKPISQQAEKVIAPVFKDACESKLLSAAWDSKDALDFIRNIESKSGEKFEVLDVGYTMISPRNHGSWTLWIKLDSIGIQHITETWYYHDGGSLESKYQKILDPMLDSFGEPSEDDWDYAFWEAGYAKCGDIMILLHHGDGEHFISRRIMFR